MSDPAAPASEREGSGGRSPFRNPFWLTFILVIVVLALVTTYAGIRAIAQLAEHQLPEKAVIRLIVNGRPHNLPDQAVQQLFPQLAASLSGEPGRIGAEVGAEIDRRVDEAFAPVFDYIPRFSDWYYSLPGEYSRYAAALGGDVGAFMQSQFHEIVAKPSNLEGRVEEIPGHINLKLAEQIRQSLAAVAERLEAFAVEQGIGESPDYVLRIEETVDLGVIIEQKLRITATDIAQQAATAAIGVGAGVAVAKGLGALVVKKGVAKVAGTKGFQLAAALLAKFAIKMAAKGGGAAAAAAAGAVLCSPTGPGAILCGAIAGGITWLLVDEAFIAFDEAINREAFEGEIRQAILDQREELKAQLKAVYQQTAATQYAELQGQFEMRRPQPIQQDFVPATAIERK